MKTGAIVLAAGEGTRMHAKEVNKVALCVGDKPMVLHSVQRFELLGIHPIVIVVGFAKQSVMELFGETVIFAEQKERLGTAHAASVGLQKMPHDIEHLFVVYGDDFGYPLDAMQKVLETHIQKKAAMTFLTITVDNAYGLGRIVRDKQGKLMKIVEEKDATDEEKSLCEINPGCFLFRKDFLEKYLPKVKKSDVTGEYYLTSIIDISLEAGEPIETIQGGSIPWKGINTPEELQEAKRIYTKIAV